MKSIALFAAWLGVVQAYYGFENRDLRIAIAETVLPLNEDVTQQTIKTTICTPGWTKTVRPTLMTTSLIKLHKLSEVNKTPKEANLYELDHIIPLELGGATVDVKNLQLQLWPEAREKDQVENCLKETVCAGAVSLDEARRMIWEDWREARAHCAPGTDHPYIPPLLK